MYDFKNKRGGEKGIERIVGVALPSCQCRVSAHIIHSKTPHCQSAQPKMAAPSLASG